MPGRVSPNAAVRTSAGAVEAQQFVLALGSHSHPVARTLGLRLPVYPLKGYSITLDTTEASATVPRVNVTDAARNWLAEKGYDPGFGARPMARLIEDRIKRPLSEALLFGDLENGGAVVVDLKDDAPDVQVVKSSPGLLQ